MPNPTPHDRLTIALTAGCCERTVLRAYRGDRIASSTRARVERAAVELGLAPPPCAAEPLRAPESKP